MEKITVAELYKMYKFCLKNNFDSEDVINIEDVYNIIFEKNYE